MKKKSWKFWLFKKAFIWLPIFFAVNWIYQTYKKPSELIGLLDSQFQKTPEKTWSAHGDTFREKSTEVMTAEFLAALAQVESSGNPIARTFWSWRFSLNPFEVFKPSSSAQGMFQITDGTLKEASRYCVQEGQVVEKGCWYRKLYNRLVPGHAIEMTSAYLHMKVTQLVQRYRNKHLSLHQKQNLAAIIHLCGVAKGEKFIRQGLSFSPSERCGNHSPNLYLRKVQAMQARFARLVQN